MEVLLFSVVVAALTALGLLILIAAMIYLWLGRRAYEQTWIELARRSNLSYRAGGFFKHPYLEGQYRNRAVTLDIHSHRAGSGSDSGNFPFTRLQIAIHNPNRLKLIVQDKHRLPSFLKATTPSGDPAVDSKFTIISAPPDLAIKMFNSSSLRERILAANSFNLEISNQSLIFESRGIEKEVDDLLFMFELQSDIAAFIESARPAFSPGIN
jgi:hypothetical protein